MYPIVWKHLPYWKIWFSNLLGTISTFSSLFQVKNICALIPNSLEFSRGTFMFILKIPIRYDWIFILIIIKMFTCLLQGTKQFYLHPRRPYLLRNACVGVTEFTEKAGIVSLICFAYPHSPVSRGITMILVSEWRYVLFLVGLLVCFWQFCLYKGHSVWTSLNISFLQYCSPILAFRDEISKLPCIINQQIIILYSIPRADGILPFYLSETRHPNEETEQNHCYGNFFPNHVPCPP